MVLADIADGCLVESGEFWRERSRDSTIFLNVQCLCSSVKERGKEKCEQECEELSGMGWDRAVRV